MPKIRKGLKKRRTLLKRPNVELPPINPKEIPQHLLDKLPSGFKLNSSMQDLRRTMMNSLTQPFIPQISPQQQQLNQLRDNNDNKERLINDVARSLEQERERKKELKMKENENKMKNQDNEHELKMREQELKNEIENKKMKHKIEEKQRELDYQEAKLNSTHSLATAEDAFNSKLAELNEKKIENERLTTEIKNNQIKSNFDKAERTVESLRIENEAMKKTLEELKTEYFLKQFHERVNEQQKLTFENELLNAMLKQERENQCLKLEKKFQPDENSVKAVEEQYKKELEKVKKETLDLESESERVKELNAEIQRKKQLIKENELAKERISNETERIKKMNEGFDVNQLDEKIKASIATQVAKEKEFEVENSLKDLNDEIRKNQIGIETQKHRNEFEKSLAGRAYNYEIAYQAAEAERTAKKKELMEKEGEHFKLKMQLEAQKEVRDFIYGKSYSEADEGITQEIEKYKERADVYAKYMEDALRDEQIARQIQEDQEGKAVMKINNWIRSIEVSEAGRQMLQSFDAPKNISYLEILNDESIPLKFKYYNDFRKEFNIPDTI